MRVVLLTGCSSGIGLHAALAFARQGDRVYATMRSPSKSGALTAAAAAEGLSVMVSELDVTKDDSVRKAVGQVLEAEGRIDVLVNNAGITHFGSVELLPEELMRAIFETNLFGAVRMIRAVLPTMRAQGSGSIVNVSSLAGRLPTLPVHGFYAASKHGLSVLSDALALEVEAFGIRVACVEPGFFATDIMHKAVRSTEDGSPYQALEEAVVAACEREIGQSPDPKIVADAIVAAADGTRDGSVHVLVGDDAEQFTEAFRTLSELEYTALVREYVGMKPVALSPSCFRRRAPLACARVLRRKHGVALPIEHADGAFERGSRVPTRSPGEAQHLGLDEQRLRLVVEIAPAFGVAHRLCGKGPSLVETTEPGQRERPRGRSLDHDLHIGGSRVGLALVEKPQALLGLVLVADRAGHVDERDDVVPGIGDLARVLGCCTSCALRRRRVVGQRLNARIRKLERAQLRAFHPELVNISPAPDDHCSSFLEPALHGKERREVGIDRRLSQETAAELLQQALARQNRFIGGRRSFEEGVDE